MGLALAKLPAALYGAIDVRVDGGCFWHSNVIQTLLNQGQKQS